MEIKEIDNSKNKLLDKLHHIAIDPSISEETKIHTIIHATALVCAIIAVQPIPFADLFILSPVQLVMVVSLNKVINGIDSKADSKELLAYIAGVVGRSVCYTSK